MYGVRKSLEQPQESISIKRVTLLFGKYGFNFCICCKILLTVMPLWMHVCKTLLHLKKVMFSFFLLISMQSYYLFETLIIVK